MITTLSESPLVTFMRAQLPVASRLPDGVRVDLTMLRALLEAHDEWAQTLAPPSDNGESTDRGVAEVAAMFKRSRSWVYLQMKHGHFPDAYEVRGAYRFPKGALDAFIAAERVAILPASKQVAASPDVRGKAMRIPPNSTESGCAREADEAHAAPDTTGAPTVTHSPETLSDNGAEVAADAIAALPRLAQVQAADVSTTSSVTELASASHASAPAQSTRNTTKRRGAARQPAQTPAAKPASAGKKLSWSSWRAVSTTR